MKYIVLNDIGWRGEGYPVNKVSWDNEYLVKIPD